MFTGIIEAVGKIVTKRTMGGDCRIGIETGKLDLSDVKLGDSIAVNGVCLTVITLSGVGFSADVSLETLSHTTLSALQVGSRVNLEKALTLSTRLGGHLVSGHVDGVGEVVEYRADARSIRIGVKAPDQLLKYLAHKGSVCVDGISLTINAIQGNVFQLNIVPHTGEQTTIQTWKVGSQINIEVDLLARYLERLLLAGDEPSAAKQAQANETGLTKAFLSSRGFL